MLCIITSYFMSFGSCVGSCLPTPLLMSPSSVLLHPVRMFDTQFFVTDPLPPPPTHYSGFNYSWAVYPALGNLHFSPLQ